MAKLHKLWRFFPNKPELKKQLCKSINISQDIAQLLINRGIVEEQAAYQFIYGDLANIADPFLLKDMDKAVERIVRAITHCEKIVVYGDYDVDGITATALMVKVLSLLGANADYYIPDRQSEGYGLNIEALEQLVHSKTQLMITVDCGISAVDEIKSVNNQLDIIVTDHHQPPQVLPEALAIINPKRLDCSYPEKNLAGVGVAFKLCQAIWQTIKKTDMTEFLDIVAFGTIADIVPLVGENRILVKEGLKQLSNTDNIGLRALINTCGLTSDKLDSGKIGYVLAPRLNAAGRLGRAAIGVELLLTTDIVRAEELAETLNHENSQRQAVEKEILSKVEEQLSKVDLESSKVLVLAGENWHVGVIGIVASRIVDRYYRPTVIISLKDGMGKASCRSIPGFDIYNALNQCSDLLIQYGGHRQAAGLSVTSDKIEALRERLSKIAEEVLTAEDFLPVLNIDCMVGLEEVNMSFLEQIACLEPFGMGNPSPVFACKDVTLADIRSIGQDGRHLKFRVRRKNYCGDGIAWEMGKLTEQFPINSHIDIAFQPEINNWNGICNVQLRAHDIRQNTDDLTEIDKLFITDHSPSKYTNILDKESFFTKIVGVTFNDRQVVIAKLTVGQQLSLKRDPLNTYDTNAIIVKTVDGEEVGFLRSELSRELAGKLDSGLSYNCIVTDITGIQNSILGVNVRIYKPCVQKNNCSINDKSVGIDDIRKALLGDRNYHDSQKIVLNHLAASKNTLAIMGTGRGKSAIFQTHAADIAIREKKMTIIIYPLRALVNDQYLSLTRVMCKLGIRVFKGNGTLTTEERAMLFEALNSENVDVLLTTPEFIQANIGYIESQINRIGFFVVDECHHISHSSKQRPVYQRLGQIMAKLGNPLVLGVTATADDETVNTIKNVLDIKQVIIDKTIRHNLVLSDARNTTDKLRYIINIIKRQEKTLIFVNSRKTAFELANQIREYLPESAQQIGFYHAGLNNEWRVKVENWFRDGTLNVVVATSAFGEGIDLSDIRHLIKYHMAFNLTTFNQQCGRAGRDGETSTIHLLFGNDDIKLNDLILKDTVPERETIGRIYLILKELHKEKQKIDISNSQISEIVSRKYKDSISERGIGAALKILEELNLVWRETSGSRREIFLCPVPSQKLDIEQSTTYYEGILEKTEFSLFANRIMKLAPDEILSCINKPLYPREFLEEVE
ncbi:single-stranded-DNA-specific exonuclease RecJ [Dendrosporobacter sp. 1207_IL3150]|uniref:single-stranded-DNA-specific exonuclease RecJ n=1 Tax=Dendrosporobacter sp. 1207_IL3150 TaxID=3084054 RepID=UPI002FD92657